MPPSSSRTVHFATSCRPAVAAKFDRAIASLHSFEFGEHIAGSTTCWRRTRRAPWRTGGSR